MKLPASKSDLTDKLAMDLARRYTYHRARPGQGREKAAWVAELRLQVAAIVSLTVQDNRILLRSEYEILKVQLYTAYKHVYQ